VVVVSHDRSFLDTVTDETIIFRDKKLTYHSGNYSDFLGEKYGRAEEA